LCGREYFTANFARIFATGGYRENGEQPVAHELEDFPTVLQDCRHLAVKIAMPTEILQT
jgi:hypothetical protein